MPLTLRSSILSLAALPAIASAQSFRPPATPLITSDPYLSVWSESDTLNGGVTRHWTRSPQPLTSLIRVDGTSYRVMGASPETVPPMKQLHQIVTATKSTYVFAGGNVKVVLAFLTPALPQKLDIYSRPLTYITWTVSSLDGKPHSVQLLDGTSSLLSVNKPDQKVEWKTGNAASLRWMRAGTTSQIYLRNAGDDTRIDWGYIYVAADRKLSKSTVASLEAITSTFQSSGKLPEFDTIQPRPANESEPTLAFTFDLGKVKAATSRHLMVAYDEVYAIDYYGKKLRPYWRRNGDGPAELFAKGEHDYSSLTVASAKFDAELNKDAARLGGKKYAQIVSLAYRECVAGNGLAADANKQPLFFTKENTSNGDIATVDVIFPMDPIWVLFSPTLAKSSLVTNFVYAASPHWKFQNAPHDLGTYPQVFGRDDGGEGMPVEESGNMIILVDAISRSEGNAKFAKQWWPQLTTWAKYLEKYGLDPEDQLCTDDFMGHLAHNANLSVKAILALASYGDLAKQLGMPKVAAYYTKLARIDAQHWVKVADAGDRSLLAFDQPNTWSQKYNLVWDQLLGLNIFPKTVRQKEIAYYKTRLQPYGLPLDSRTKLTKADWSIWSATMADTQSDFQLIVDPIWLYLNETTVHDPIADSYTTTELNSDGMHARPVVGGLFIKLLSDPAVWKKWASRDKEKLGTFAPLPKAPKVKEVVASGMTGKPVWKYVTAFPGSGWTKTSFDDSTWSSGTAGFGSDGTPSLVKRTDWTSDNIWIRREITVPNVDINSLQLEVYHDEDVEVYIDGVLALKESGYMNKYQPYEISAAALALLKPGKKVTIAAHCHQTTGGQGIDIGFAIVKPSK